jgi:hypothetical protein
MNNTFFKKQPERAVDGDPVQLVLRFVLYMIIVKGIPGIQEQLKYFYPGSGYVKMMLL